MRQPSPERPRLRKREIVFAVAAGLLAAGGAALILDDDGGGGGPDPVPVVAGPNALNYQVAQFDEISTVGPQDVVITYGETASVRSEGSPEALSLLEAVVEDGQLIIRPKDRFNGWAWGRLDDATFHVTVPRLDAVAVAGSGNVRVDRIAGDNFEGSIAGPGELSIGVMAVKEADFRIGGSGNVAVADGVADETRVSIGGSGEVRAGGLRSGTASVSIGGSGDVALTVQDEADVSIAGSGDVNISGPGRCSVTRMGGGDVRCEGGGGTDD